ncbi:DUF4214 domain-containing protein [Mesobacterium sp. TK19101]|uniref:DUF4214 domain-containing protein n=1 Tax=Mesobacterium hydrothermale TaxID=3111907 RepID=A0ABU6HF50_9RHOB|nr:DUF4214 domain-containing protein [Mesobacterium sp. TK19101]MEC3860470.1 DUF4214 domain-containing protein [Mesobacterium sp. TK19101]
MVNSFERTTGALARAINAEAIDAPGMRRSDFGGPVAAHHLLPVESLTEDFQNAVNDATARAGFSFNVDAAANGVWLPTTTASQQLVADTHGYMAMQHSGGSVHTTYSWFVQEKLDDFAAAYDLEVRSNPAQAAANLDLRIKNFQAFLRDGLVNTDGNRIFLFTKKIDLEVQKYLDNPDFDLDEIYDYYHKTLDNLKDLDFLSRVSIGRASDVPGSGQVFYQEGKVSALNLNTKLASGFDRVASKADGIITGATILLGLYAVAGAASRALEGKSDTESVIDLVKRSNISVDPDLLKDIAQGAIKDAVLSVAAALTGLGLVWKGYQLVQGMGDLRTMLALADAYNDDPVTEELNAWISWVETEVATLAEALRPKSLLDVATLVAGGPATLLGKAVFNKLSDMIDTARTAKGDGAAGLEELHEQSALTMDLLFTLGVGSELNGSWVDDRLMLLPGHTLVRGQVGTDTLMVAGRIGDWEIVPVSNLDGSIDLRRLTDNRQVKLYSIERVEFSDGVLDLVPTDTPPPAPPPEVMLPTIQVEDATVGEGGVLQFRVHLGGTVAETDVTFRATTYLRETGGDYDGFIDKAFTLRAGTSETLIEVQTTADKVPEDDEVMSLNIHTVSGAQPPAASAAWADGTIANDDGAFAALLFEGQTVTGTLPAGGSQVYRVVTSGEGTLRIDLSRMTANADLEVLNNRFERIGDVGISSANASTADERVDFAFEPNQLYFVRLTSAGAETPFTLTLAPEFGDNGLPTARDDSLTVAPRNDGTIVVQKSALLANDSDPDGDPLRLSFLDGDGFGPTWVGNGTAQEVGDTIVFTPDGSGLPGRFAYAVTDDKSIHHDWALVTLNDQDAPEPGIDLAIENVRVNDLSYAEFASRGFTLPRDDPFRISYDVVNIGTATAEAQFVATGIAGSNGITQINASLPALSPGARTTITLSPRVDADAAGWAGFSPFVDLPRRILGDVDYDNNIQHKSVFFTDPLPTLDVDFQLSDVTIDGTPYATWHAAGMTIEDGHDPVIGWTITNTGTDASPVGFNVPTGLYLADGSGWLGTALGPFAAGQSKTVQLDPESAGLGIGVHGFGIRVNTQTGPGLQLVPETDDTNNRFSGTIQIEAHADTGTAADESWGLSWPDNPLALAQDEAAGSWILGVARMGTHTNRAAVATLAYSGTATRGEDFTGTTELVIGQNEGHETDGHGLRVDIIDDALDEADIETIKVTLLGVRYQDDNSAARLNPLYDSVTLALRDDDSPGGGSTGPEVRIIPSSADESRALRFTFDLLESAASPVTLTYEIGSGTATEGLDFVSLPGQQTVTLSNATPQRFIEVATLPDALVEPDETVRLTVVSVSGGHTAEAYYDATILDDDDGSGAALWFRPDVASVVEGGSATFSLQGDVRQLTGVQDAVLHLRGLVAEDLVSARVTFVGPNHNGDLQPQSHDYALVNGDWTNTATGQRLLPDSDGAPALFMTLPAQIVASRPQDFRVQIVMADDAVVQGDRSVVIGIEPYVGTDFHQDGTVGTLARLTVTDNDTAPAMPGSLSVSAVAAQVVEGDATPTVLSFDVTRSGGSDGAVSVAWSVPDGTGATLPGGGNSGTIRFADGESGAKRLTLQRPANTEDGPDVPVTVTLTNPTGGVSVVAAQSTVTVLDDDVSVPAIDLLTLDGDEIFVSGTPGQVSLTVEAPQGANAQDLIEMHWSADDQLDGGDLLLSSQTAGTLAASGVHTRSFRFATMPSDGAEGYVIATLLAQADGAVLDTVMHAARLSDTPLPNLLVSGGSAPNDLFVGQATTITASIKNKGTSPYDLEPFDEATGASTQAVTVRAYLSEDDTLDATDHLLGQADAAPVQWNEKTSVQVAFTLPEGLGAGDRRIIWVIDPDDRLTETTKADNLRVVTGLTLHPENVRAQVLGPGADLFVGAETADWVFSASGRDTLIGAGGADTLINGSDDSLIFGDGVDPHVVVTEASAVYRLYAATFGRLPDRGGYADWTEKLVTGQAELAAVARGFVVSQEFSQRYGALQDGAFIDLLYQNVLGRAADAGGRADWVARLDAGQTRADVLLGFSNSAEFTAQTAEAAAQFARAGSVASWGDAVFRLYQATLDRMPDLAGFKSWSTDLAAESSLSQIVPGFTGSAEFQQRYGGLGNGGFVDLLYRNVLGRDADPVGRSDWLARLDAGESRADVVLGFSESPEFVRASLPRLTEWMRAAGPHDIIAPDSGTHKVAGGEMADVFVFDGWDSGHTTVLDFEPWDYLRFNDFGVDSAQDIIDRTQAHGRDTAIVFDQLTVLLRGVSVDSLDVSDILV